MAKITKKQFYEEGVKPYLSEDDRPYNRELYNNTLDMYQREGLISEEQASKWSSPKNSKFYSKTELQNMKRYSKN